MSLVVQTMELTMVTIFLTVQTMPSSSCGWFLITLVTMLLIVQLWNEL